MVSHSGSSQNDDGTPKAFNNNNNNNGSSSSSLGASGGGSGKQAQQPVLKKGPWTAAEDSILVDYVKKNGEGNWNAVQKNTSLARCGKSCRLRWTNHLRPNLKKGSFTPEEERLILQLHAQLGNKWARMAAQLPGRTDNEIKNYWNTRIKCRIRQGLPLYPPDVIPQNPPASPPPLQPSSPEPQFMASPSAAATTFRARPHIQIPTRTLSPSFGQSPTQSLSPVALSPQSYIHLKTSFTNSLSLFEPSTTSLPSPPSTHLTASPLLYTDPNLNLSPYQLQFSVASSSGSSVPRPISPTTTHYPNVNSFQFNPLNFNMNSSQSLQKTHLDPIYSVVKPELPSSQLYLFQTEKPETGGTGSNPNNFGLLDDLLKEAEAYTSVHDSTRPGLLLNLHDEKFDFSLKPGCGWDATDSSTAGFRIKGEVNDQIESISMHEDLSKLLNDIPSCSVSLVPQQHNNNNNGLEHNSNQSHGYNSGLTEDSIALEMQQIASLLDEESTRKEPPSRSWNSFARIC